MKNVYVDIRNENEWIRKTFENKDFVSIDEIFNKIDDMLGDIEFLKEKIEEMKQNVEVL